jgi:hypothetical protein
VSGLLIVNADDWGADAAGTARIERAFAAGAITSTTAMVHMAHSAAAAGLAAERGRPTGLHLNLTEPFDGPGVPPALRERQRRACAHLAPLPRRRWIPAAGPRMHRLLADALADQLEAYRELYGGEPTHLDSHHHAHTCLDVLGVLPAGMRVRQTRSGPPGRRAHALSRAKHALMARRFVTTACFWALDDVATDAALDACVRTAAARPVEVMVHPSFAGELERLAEQRWTATIARAPLGDYGVLDGR